MQLPVTEFKKFVDLAASFTAKKDIVPILQHLVFRGKIIYAFDGVSGAVMNTPWSFGPGFSVQAERLTRMLNSLDGVVQEISMEDGKESVVFKGGGFRATFKTLSLDLFSFPTLPAQKQIVALPAEWGKQVMETVFSISKDETKPYIRGVFVKDNQAKTTDGYRITAGLCRSPVTVLLPDTLISRMGEYVEKIIAIGQTDTLEAVYIPEGALFTLKVEGSFPNLDPRMAEFLTAMNNDDSVIGISSLDIAPLASAIRRVMLFVDKDIFTRLRLTAMLDGTLKVETVDNQTEGAVEIVPVSITRKVTPGEEFSFLVNGKFFLEAWERCGSFYVVKSSELPLYFRRSDNTLRHYLLRLQD